ncbi:hypothetical protein D9757_002456 [Collybiopsis confluens]|uniref:C3H1-type domain-containing protein n=1 Tax=Collybiopsis confluens TaxID=2823264 RepID=A0A8H5HY15_9AGAR|nr:hypothetical protein D9757_002456 [Collybiopsis confluens]
MGEIYKPLDIPGYYGFLARNYTQLTLFDEAEAVATRALELQPSRLSARYHRAVARLKMDDLHGAVADVDALCQLVPKIEMLESKFPGIQQMRDSLYATLQVDHPSEVIKKTLSWPGPRTPPAPLTNEDHRPRRVDQASGKVRNTPPCRRYNRDSTSCQWHGDCGFSHTPDVNSIRDTKEQNVCLTFLLGRCPRRKCYYKHSTSDLPSDVTTSPSCESTFTLKLQWWNDIIRLREVGRFLDERGLRLDREYQERVKAREAKAGKAVDAAPKVSNAPASSRVVEAVKKDVPPLKAHASAIVPSAAAVAKTTTIGREKPETGYAKKSSNKKTNPSMAATPVPAGAIQKFKEKKAQQQQQHIMAASSKVNRYPLSRSVKALEKFANCGFTDDDVGDLLEFGMNPWDENAHSVFAEVDDWVPR